MYNIYLEEETWLKKVHQTVVNDELDKNDKIAWYVFLFGLGYSYFKLNCLQHQWFLIKSQEEMECVEGKK